MSEAIRKIWDAIKYGPEDKLITFESPETRAEQYINVQQRQIKEQDK